MTEKEIEIVKICAALVATHYDSSEPWIGPNVILRRFNLTPWELIDGAWHDPETSANHPFI